MNVIRFALKRALGKPLFILLLFLCAAAIPLAGSLSRAAALPPAGICSLSDSPQAQRITAYLLSNGFLLFDDPAEMEILVEQGELDCAGLLPADLPGRLAECNMEGCVRWVVSPTSFAPTLYQSHLSAALFREYTPCLTATVFEGTAVTREEVLRSYEAMFEEGYAFSFDLLTAEDGTEPPRSEQQGLMLGTAAILLCAVVFSSCTELADTSFRALLGRVGLRRAFTELLLPGAFLRALLIAAAGCAGMAAAGHIELLLPVSIYVFLLTGLGLLLSFLFPGSRQLYTLLVLLILASLALCPIFTDLSLFSPVVGAVRILLPPYWLLLMQSSPLLWSGLAVLSCLAGIAFPLLRHTVFEKYRFLKS